MNPADPRQLVAAYDRDGYVVVQQLLPADQFAILQANLDRCIREVVPSLPTIEAFARYQAAAKAQQASLGVPA